ncbi:MAG: hypothetical protein ACRYE8_05660 [Janthinobacterium lividum]
MAWELDPKNNNFISIFNWIPLQACGMTGENDSRKQALSGNDV